MPTGTKPTRPMAGLSPMPCSAKNRRKYTCGIFLWFATNAGKGLAAGRWKFSAHRFGQGTSGVRLRFWLPIRTPWHSGERWDIKTML